MTWNGVSFVAEGGSVETGGAQHVDCGSKGASASKRSPMGFMDEETGDLFDWRGQSQE